LHHFVAASALLRKRNQPLTWKISTTDPTPL